MKRMWSLLLATILLVGMVAGLDITAQATDYQGVSVTANQLQTGDTFLMGTYPQTRVTDASVLNALNDTPCTMVSYGYMKNSSAGNHTFDTVKLQYADIACNGELYRKVTINEYRPFWTSYAASTSNTNQDENGYTIRKTYYFKWEPIVWQVLANESDSVYVMSQTLLDSQAYHNYYEGITWQNCSLRQWLNNDFYNAAFSANEKANIVSTYHVNEANPYFDTPGGASTRDNLWVLSYSDSINSDYGFAADYAVNDTARQKQGSDYAKCQGLCVNASGSFAGNSMWWMRTPGVNAVNACGVNYNGYAYNYYYVYGTNRGVAPAFRLLPDAVVGESDAPEVPVNDCSQGHTFVTEVTPPTCAAAGYTTYTCSVCGYSYADDDTDPLPHSFGDPEIAQDSTISCLRLIRRCTGCGYTDVEEESIDNSALVSALDEIALYQEEDYSAASLVTLKQLGEDYSYLITTPAFQTEYDTATAEILNAIAALQPYLNCGVNAENSTCLVRFDGESTTVTQAQQFTDILFGTEITLNIVPASGYVFKGWYETKSHRIFSTDTQCTFTLTSNTDIEALCVADNEASIYFTNDSGYIKDIITKTTAEWAALTVADIDELMPPVPYRYGSTDGHWECEEADYLSLLRQGSDVVFTAEYTDVNRPDEEELPAVNANGVPHLQLSASYDESGNVCTFIMGAGIAPDCHIVSVGIAFQYGRPSAFQPEDTFVTLNNKMLTSKFEALPESGYYIVNVKRFNRYSWAAKGYVTYYDAFGTLKAAYTDQINFAN